jgi:Methyltransferase domain
MLDLEFMQIASKMEGGFGTENVGPLLYALIKISRPKSVLEIGAGYSTLFILKALRDNLQKDYMEREEADFPYGSTEYYDTPYNPMLISLDDFSHPKSVAKPISQFALFLELDKFITFKDADFRGFSKKIEPHILPFDFVWFDCGGLREYEDFIDEYWEIINPNGGIILLHSTQTNLDLQLFIQTIKLRQATSEFLDFELLSLLEPNKKIQNSVTMIRMTSKVKNPIYTIHP